MNAHYTLLIVILSAAGLSAQKFRFAVRGTVPGGQLGSAVAPAGDVDRDGKRDFLVTVPHALHIRVVSGRDGHSIHDLPVGQSATMDGGQDANGDGYPDILIGEPYADANGRRSGRVVIYSGKTFKPIATSSGSGANRGMGQRVRWIGDVDRDGKADFMTDQMGGATSPWFQVVVCSGASGKVLGTMGGLGQRMTAESPGDLDGDGYPEILIKRIQGGSLEYYELYSSKDGKAKWRSTSAHGGTAACWPGDMNGDGVKDLVLAFYHELVAYSGKEGKVIFRTGEARYLLAAVGDVDGDGAADVAAAYPGYVVIHSGKSGQWVYRIAMPGLFVAGLATIGDLDGDRALEFVMGVPFDTNQPRRYGGAAYVFSSKYRDATLRPFGSGCAGGAAPPRFTNSKSVVRMGAPFDLNLDRLPGPTAGGVWVGASNSTWSGGRLPFDLSVLGMKGCQLLVAPHIHLPFRSSGTSLRLRVAVPFNYSCVGAPVFFQAYCVDKNANALGVATSHGLQGLLGT